MSVGVGHNGKGVVIFMAEQEIDRGMGTSFKYSRQD